MLCFVNLFAFLFMHNFKRQQSASMLLNIVACMALAIISLCELKVPVITSLNYDGCSFIFTFHFQHFVSLAPLLPIHGMPCICLFKPVSNWLSHIYIFFSLPLKTWQIGEKEGKGTSNSSSSICILFHCKASLQLFLFIGFTSNLLDMFIGTTCHKKISGVNFFLFALMLMYGKDGNNVTAIT